ncbi:hypothetical protein [Methylibium petroleiphilum]|uniref:Uncharacterized protein n=1 Tax=Methylibium petroleiphilum (strain ATCC BAA-1232 / LMG 22953 / PM1) TaxID=420662 RepID=A2SMN3_METPP|nr:hypothetical protein [Methylibium petroleiphilum]ABM96822.1 hypothetical protein Mpe_B0042 [Methylibium petroleiphilum PM1]
MNISFLRELRANVRYLLDESGMTVDGFAKSRKVPKKLLEGILACNEHNPELASHLALLSDRLGFSVAQLLSPNLSCGSSGNLPVGDSPDHILARQIGRLIEDFVDCDESGRFEVTALAQELAEEHLRRRANPLNPNKPSG